MTLRKCKECGKEFDAKGTQVYCNDKHYRICAVCGKKFEVDLKNPKKCCSRKCSAQLRKQTIKSKTKICELCGKEFIPESNTQRYCKKDHYRPCPICGKPVLVKAAYDVPRTCSNECEVKLRAQTSIFKYGVDIPSKSEVVRQKLHDKSVDPNIIEKRRQTCIDKYGVDNPAKAEEIRKKISQSVSSKECQDKTRNTCIERYGVPFAMQSEYGLSKYSNTVLEKYGVPYYCMTDDCKSHNGQIISRINREFGKVLKEHNILYKHEYSIQDKSYDFYILNTDILIELNPTYTHNTVGNHWGNGVSISYHYDKYKLAKDAGYRCIQVWDWDDINKVISLLSPKTTIYARKCKLQGIDNKTVKTFEDTYHLQNNCNGQIVCYGLYYEDELVEIMTFGKPRYNNNYEWELLRLCTDSKYYVVGGAERLFKHFIRIYNPNSIISYCDLSKFTGEVYERLRFTLHHINPPNKVWSKGSKKITNNLLLQRGYDQLFYTNYGKGTSNEELMLKDGWLPVYDCGQAAYIYHK